MNTAIKYEPSVFKAWSEDWVEEVKVIILLFAVRLCKRVDELDGETKKQLLEDAKDFELRGVFNE